MSPRRSVPLPTITGRLEVISLDDFVDEMMEHMGAGVLDLRDARHRSYFREWLRKVLDHYLTTLERDLSKGAERGVCQILTLARDPAYYERATRRRGQRRVTQARQNAKDAESTARWLASREAHAAETQKMIEDGRLKLFPGTRLPERDGDND